MKSNLPIANTVAAPRRLIQPAPFDDKQASAAAIRALLEQARQNQFLSVGIDAGQAELLWTAKYRKKRAPCITLKKYGRWYSVGAHLFGDVLTDAARNRIYEALSKVSLPGSLVRVSNATLIATRLPLLSGAMLAEWLAIEALNYREKGSGREYCRWEGRKMVDGSVKLLHRGQDRAQKRRAA